MSRTEPRLKGTGNIRERKPGVFEFKVFRGIAPDGRKYYWYMTFHGTRKQAEREIVKFAVEVAREVKATGLVNPSAAGTASTDKRDSRPLSVDELLAEYIRFKHSRRNKHKDSTNERYLQYARNISEQMGNMHVTAVGAEALERVYDHLATKGGVKNEGLSRSTIHNINSLVGAAFRWGIGRGKAGTDPTVGICLPSADDDDPEAMQVLNVEQTNVLIQQCLVSTSKWALPTLISATTGMRRGECCAVKWTDIDWEKRTISISCQLTSRSKITSPKTKTSRRKIVVPQQLIAALKKHQDAQQLEQIANRPKYYNQGFVCAREDGSPLHPDNLSRGFKSILKASGLPSIRFHDLRHTFASIILKTKPVHVVSAYLGHANPRVTLEVYAHCLPGIGDEVAIALEQELDNSEPPPVWESAA